MAEGIVFLSTDCRLKLKLVGPTQLIRDPIKDQKNILQYFVKKLVQDTAKMQEF